MELHEYPRPANDTGIGIHWCPGYAAAVGMAKIRETWIPELRALGIKWVKIYNHDGALDFAELLLAEGFMPIVRLYRPTPNPGRLSLREIVHVDSFVRSGVRYFEFNSEPDRDSEWRGGRVPANGLDLVAEDTIVSLEAILERGGMPAVPAVSNGSTWDIVGRIVARGRKDLFEGPVWQAVHNYTRNRPLDYPFDIGNQEGAAYTERFYRTVADEQWEENAWRGRSLAEVNRLRLDRCAPGATLKEDHACWLAFQRFDALNRHHLGRSIPILATEGGYLIGEDSDARYPATTPNLHMAQTLEACRVMMGTSSRFPAAPDAFFCATFAVVANQQLGGSSAWWEKFAWFSERWPGGALPIVRALRAEPKVVRKRHGQPDGALITLRGAVLNARERYPILLERSGMQVASALIDANSRYVLPDLSPGSYVLRVPGLNLQQPVTLTADQTDMVVNLDAAAQESRAAQGNARGQVFGRVEGGAGVSLILVRHSDGEEYVTTARDDGGFRFVDLAAGAYSLRVMPAGTRAESLMLDGRSPLEVDLAVAGWGHTIALDETASGVGAVRVRVAGRSGVPVQAHYAGGSTPPVLTGSDPALPADCCQINGLENGLYIVSVGGVQDGAGLPTEPEARVTIDRRALPVVEFSFHRVEPPQALQQSSIVGRVIGPLERLGPLKVRLLDSHAGAIDLPLGADGSFRFEKLLSGNYTVEVVGYEEVARRHNIALDGGNQVSVDLLLPVQPLAAAASAPGAGRSVVQGQAPGTAGRLARLVDAVGNETRAVVGLDDVVRFERLAAGDYTLTIEGGYEQNDLYVDGETGQEVLFAPLASSWEVEVSKGESMPGYSTVRVEVEGLRDVPVYIWKQDWEGMMKRSGTGPNGPFSLEFSPLGPGTYMIEPEGLGIWTDVELTGLEAVWITFRPRTEPTHPNLVTTLQAAAVPAPAAEPEPDRPRHYIFIGDASLSGLQLSELLSFASREYATAGTDLGEALLCDIVTVVGDSPNTENVREHLASRGITVRTYTPVA